MATNSKYQGIPDPPYFMGIQLSGTAGVISFNGRVGAVLPGTGDYNQSQVTKVSHSIDEIELTNDDTGNVMGILNNDSSSAVLSSSKMGSIPSSKLTGQLALALMPFILGQDPSVPLTQNVQIRGESPDGQTATIDIETGDSGYFLGAVMLTSYPGTIAASAFSTNATSMTSYVVLQPAADAQIFLVHVIGGSLTSYSITVTDGTNTILAFMSLGVGF